MICIDLQHLQVEFFMYKVLFFRNRNYETY